MEYKDSNAVSIIMPLYNSEPFIIEALESVFSQTYKNIQLVLVDDYSSDNTYSIVSNLIKGRSNTILIKNKYAKGIVGADNTGLQLCRGRYIAFFDHDDISLSNRIKDQVDYLNKNPQVGACGGWMKEFGFGDKVWSYSDNFEYLKASSIFHTPVPSPTAMIRLSVVKKHKLHFLQQYELAEDYKFWLDVIKQTKVTNLQKVLIRYRTHPNNTLSKFPEKKYNAWKKALKEYLQAWAGCRWYDQDMFYREIFAMKQLDKFKPVYKASKNHYDSLFYSLIAANKLRPIFDHKTLCTIINEKIELFNE